MMIVNLTQHAATAEQAAAGVFDLPAAQQEALRVLLTFEAPPAPEAVATRAAAIAAIAAASGARTAMIGGAPYLMAPLERALLAAGIAPVYAFSTRASVEEALPDGSVRKVAVFHHAGFVPAVPVD